MGSKRLTNEIIDKRLNGRNIKRIGNFIKSSIKLKYQCLINGCNYIWEAHVGDVVWSGTGCPKCAGTLKLTNEIVDARLFERNIKKLDSYSNNRTKIHFQCMVNDCGHIWFALPVSILNNNTGCPKCAKHIRLTNEIIDSRLLNRNIKRIGSYINDLTKINFKCLIEGCNYNWYAKVNDIINGGHGCPNCAGQVSLTDEIIDKRLINRDIKRIGTFNKNNKNKIMFQCLKDNCLFCWLASPHHILYLESGCPKCRAFKNEQCIFNLLKENNIDFEYQYCIRNINYKEKQYKFDFYIKSKNIAIEYNGIQHYRPVCFGGISIKRAEYNFNKQQTRDIYIKQFCNDNNIKLISIDGREFYKSKLEVYIIKELIPYLKNHNMIFNGF
jgi:very-short-patch-repair endonuclease